LPLKCSVLPGVGTQWGHAALATITAAAPRTDTAALALDAAGLRIEPRIDPRWDEYDHIDLVRRYAAAHGSEEPRSSREFQVLLDSALTAWVQHGDEGGWPAFSGGVTGALRELVQGLQKGRDAVVFTSAGVIATVCADLLDTGAAGLVALNRAAVNGAVTKLAVGRSGPTLLTFNEHTHLDGELLTYRWGLRSGPRSRRAWPDARPFR
jgi:broad specificity phosphatase PhoE